MNKQAYYLGVQFALDKYAAAAPFQMAHPSPTAMTAPAVKAPLVGHPMAQPALAPAMEHQPGLLKQVFGGPQKPAPTNALNAASNFERPQPAGVVAKPVVAPTEQLGMAAGHTPVPKPAVSVASGAGAEPEQGALAQAASGAGSKLQDLYAQHKGWAVPAAAGAGGMAAANALFGGDDKQQRDPRMPY